MYKNIEEVLDALNHGVVEFSYYTKSGRLHTTKGTTDPYTMADIRGTVPTRCIFNECSNMYDHRYWDVNVGGIRQFNEWNLITEESPVGDDTFRRVNAPIFED